MHSTLWQPSPAEPGVNRRAFLRGAAGAGAALLAPGALDLLAAPSPLPLSPSEGERGRGEGV